MVAFSRALGLNVIAEGIENAEQLTQLKDLGCELGQGYHFAEPLPKDEVEELLVAGTLQGSAGERWAERSAAGEQKNAERETPAEAANIFAGPLYEAHERQDGEAMGTFSGGPEDLRGE